MTQRSETVSDESASQLLRTLQELVEALDRRIPQVERAGEATIAHEARLLRAEASRRIALLQDRRVRVPQTL